MNLVEKLLAVDNKEFHKIEKKEVSSKQLAKVLGEKEAKVTIQAIDGDLLTELTAGSINEEGNFEYGKSYTANARIAATGIVDPPLKDEKLMKHLGVATPADAAKVIFKGEVHKIAAEINELSGFINEAKTDEEIKN